MISIIGLVLIALAEFIFDWKSNPESTNWSILYFSVMYFSFVLISIDIAYKNISESIRSLSIALGVFFVALIGIELKFINAPWDIYIESVNRIELRSYAMYLLVTSIIIITIITWVKRQSKI